jgi:hypothetical protein
MGNKIKLREDTYVEIQKQGFPKGLFMGGIYVSIPGRRSKPRIR